MSKAREIYIDRIRHELIGPGSDIFYCSDDYSDEVIEGKPLSRYYSGVLFPPKTELVDDDPVLFTEDTDAFNEFIEDSTTPNQDSINPIADSYDNSDEDEVIKLRTNLYFPTNMGLTFCVPVVLNIVDLELSFGTYTRANYQNIKIKYSGEGIELLSRFGFDSYVDFDPENKILYLKKALKGNKRRNKKSGDYLILDNLIKNFVQEISRDHILLRYLKKLIYGKDKWQRHPHNFRLKIDISKNNSFTLSSLTNDLTSLPPKLAQGIFLHLKIYHDNKSKRKFVKILLENKIIGIKAKKFLPTNERLNECCLFQVELLVNSNNLLPYDQFIDNEYLSDEDKSLNFLFEDIKSFGIGHGVSCQWELTDNPTWIKTTFFPFFDVKNQSTKFVFEDDLVEKILNIKNLSSFTDLSKTQIISGLLRFNELYKKWIDKKIIENKSRINNEIGNKNIQKCINIFNRINDGIKILENNSDAFKAFQFANSAMYMQMFHSALFFSNDYNKGFELFEWNQRFNQNDIPSYEEYKQKNFPSNNPPHWRPFQLGFILLSLRSIVDPFSEERKLVDLIWFPTGGGKTEAYLTVTSFLIFYRRIVHKEKGYGVNAIIRYTLRLLTAQQFERASKLILACEKIRRANKSLLGDKEISIGFWVGSQTIPNKKTEARDALEKIISRLNQGILTNNIFQVNSCQWCNTRTITKISNHDNAYKISIRYDFQNQGIKVFCHNPYCDFSDQKFGFPFVLIDEDIYDKPPTVIFGTIDKFAVLAWRPEGRKLFNQDNDCLPPELIIQDELHLISGPLGSIAGLYENVIQSLCEKNGITPKIIASTATAKNAENQVLKLYGRSLSIFPQFALDTKDNFFSRTEEHSLRRYIGIIPSGKTSTMTQLKILAAMLYARLDILQHTNNEIRKDTDNFWTVISYYNSLKEIGKMSNKISSELRDSTLKQIHNRLFNFTFANYRRLRFAYELTSRIPSDRIKDTLDKLNIKFENDIENSNAIDLVLATNMISVGLDVQRLGVMLVNSIPRNIAEYIQSTSRVARKNKGVIFTLFNPDDSRDLSYFEHFVSFHQKFYKEIEPLSLTPFTENTLNIMLFTSLVTFYRHKLGYYSNDDVYKFDKDEVRSAFNSIIENHKGLTESEIKSLSSKLEELLDYWSNKVDVAIRHNYALKFKSNKPIESFLKTKNQICVGEFFTMQSVRNVEPLTKIKINQY